MGGIDSLAKKRKKKVDNGNHVLNFHPNFHTFLLLFSPFLSFFSKKKEKKLGERNKYLIFAKILCLHNLFSFKILSNILEINIPIFSYFIFISFGAFFRKWRQWGGKTFQVGDLMIFVSICEDSRSSFNVLPSFFTDFSCPKGYWTLNFHLNLQFTKQ